MIKQKDKKQANSSNELYTLLCDGLVILVNDFGRMGQRSFSISEIYHGINLKKYKQVSWVEVEDNNHKKEIEKKAKLLKWEVIEVNLYG